MQNVAISVTGSFSSDKGLLDYSMYVVHYPKTSPLKTTLIEIH